MSKLTDNQFLKKIESFAAEQRLLIESEVHGFPTDEEASTNRRKQANADFKFFCKTYFPHYLTFEETSIFQQFVYDELPVRIDSKDGARLVVAAPRGEAKSTLITQLMTLWAVLTGRKHYVIIIMDVYDQAALMLEAIKAELDTNPRLKQDFQDVAGAGPTWQVGKMVTRNNRRIEGAGAAKKIRGRRSGAHRPDLILLDDIENDENVRQKKQRDKIHNWVLKAVLNLGPPDGSADTFYVGTMLHYDSVLNRFIKNPTWDNAIFKAILTMPNNMDLWQRWEEEYRNKGKEAASLYYNRRKKKMDAGAQLSWPSVRPLERLMTIRMEDHHAFDCEYQNDPTDSENSPFKNIQFWVHDNNRWIFYGACDPSLGKNNKQRDPSAVLVGGIDRKKGILDVVEANIAWRVPLMTIETIIEMQRVYTCMVWAFESVQFQEFMRQLLVDKSAERMIPVPAMPVIPNTDKMLRIESLQPHVFNGLIRLHASQTMLFDQLRHFPEADHDDGPDALEMLWKVALSGSGGIPQIHSRRTGSNSYLRGYHG